MSRFRSSGDCDSCGFSTATSARAWATETEEESTDPPGEDPDDGFDRGLLLVALAGVAAGPVSEAIEDAWTG